MTMLVQGRQVFNMTTTNFSFAPERLTLVPGGDDHSGITAVTVFYEAATNSGGSMTFWLLKPGGNPALDADWTKVASPSVNNLGVTTLLLAGWAGVQLRCNDVGVACTMTISACALAG